MELEREIAFCLEAASPEEARELLAQPDRALARLEAFEDLKLQGDVLQGALAATVALLGKVRFPFRSRFAPGEAGARLEALAPEAGELSARLSGRSWLEGSRVCYDARVRLCARLPEGEKWGGRAFRKMAEAAFARALERTLASTDRRADAGLLD
ncbi:MAG TPA: DUF3809 domain-containing protein [Oceanithermus profundus]|uniref:DUF3809 domain-containing protein n=1 Tax=Oceanithermus profundus TaxID=187137 RepID=A0A7C4Z5U2_9DEIN|nr:DUF3809 domain-containing protein [Oceanithermus profundus]